MGRFYVCPVVGTGTAENPFRPAARLKAGVYRVRGCIDSIPRGQPGAGKPRLPWTVAWVEADDWAAVEADPGLVSLGDLGVDRTPLAKPVSADTKMLLSQIGVVTGPEGDAVTDVRKLLRLLVQKHYPYADELKAFPEILPPIAGGAGPPVPFLRTPDGRLIPPIMGAATVVSDTFTDTDNTDLQDHTPETGGAWAKMGFFPLGGSAVADALINSNHLRSDNTTSSSVAYRNAANPGANEYDVITDMRLGGSPTSSSIFSLLGRMTPTGTAQSAVDYYVGVYKHQGFLDTFKLMKNVSGTLTELDALDVATLTKDTTYEIKLEIRNAAKKFYLGITEKLTTADNAITQDGRAGLGAPKDEVAAESLKSWLDDYHVEDTAAAGGVTVLAALATATVLSPVSAVVTGAMVTAVLATATALSPVATHINTVSASVATATALSPVSIVSGAAAIVGALATASALSWDATTSLGALVVGALGTATAQSYVALHINTVLASLSTAITTSWAATIITGGDVTVIAALATATALSYAATHVNTILVALPTATALSYTAAFVGGATIAGALSTATALSFDAAVIGGATIVAALSAATALSWAAVINPGVTISAVLATATALAYAAVAVVLAKLLLKAGDAFGERADTVQGSASIAPLPIGHGLIDAPADAPQVEGSGRQ